MGNFSARDYAIDFKLHRHRRHCRNEGDRDSFFLKRSCDRRPAASARASGRHEQGTLDSIRFHLEGHIVPQLVHHRKQSACAGGAIEMGIELAKDALSLHFSTDVQRDPVIGIFFMESVL